MSWLASPRRPTRPSGASTEPAAYRFRIVRIGVIALLAAALFACAPVAAVAQDAAPTRAEFVEQADGICEVPYRKAVRLVDTGTALAEIDQLVRGGKKVLRAGRLFLRTNERLAALDRPTADANAIEAWLDGTRKGFQKVKKGGKAWKAKERRRGETLLERANRAVRRAGLRIQYLSFSHCF